MLAPWLIYLVAAAVALAGFLAAFRSFDAIDDMIEDIRNPADACKSLNSVSFYSNSSFSVNLSDGPLQVGLPTDPDPHLHLAAARVLLQFGDALLRSVADGPPGRPTYRLDTV